MNKRFLIALAGAVVFGLLSIFLAQKYLEGQAKKIRDAEQTEVVMATTEIPLGTEINGQQIQIVRYPKNLLPPGAMIRAQEVQGRVAMVNIPLKTVILNEQLASPGSAPGMSGVTAPGLRSVSVRVDEASSVAGFVVPGAYVDVIAIMQPQLEGARPVSKVILQKVKVLAGGQRMETKSDGKPAQYNTVTLEVTPAQAEKLKLAESEGRLQLSIRNTTDQLVEKTPGATRRDVLADIALEQRALEGTRNYSGAAKPGATPPPFSFNINYPQGQQQQQQQPQQIPVKKVGPIGPTIELIQGSKRERIEMMP